MMDMLLQGILKYSRTPVHLKRVESVGGSMCKVRVEGEREYVKVRGRVGNPLLSCDIIYHHICKDYCQWCLVMFKYPSLMIMQRNTGFVPPGMPH